MSPAHRHDTARLEAFSDGVFAIAFNAVWRYAVTGGRLLDPGADRKAVAPHGVLALFFLLPEKR